MIYSKTREHTHHDALILEVNAMVKKLNISRIEH